MFIKTILILANSIKAERAILDTACNLAQHFHAHINGIYVFPPSSHGVIYSRDEIEQITALESEEGKGAERLFQEFMDTHHVTIREEEFGLENATASFMFVRGTLNQVVAHQGRLADLIILSRTMQDTHEEGGAELSALLEAGSPLLLLPPEKALVLGGKMMIAWNGSKEAAHAVRAALPLLLHASEVFIVTAGALREGVPTAYELKNYLQRHEVMSQIVDIHHYGSDDTDAASLMHKAVELQSTLIVMGAFTHHHLQQKLLGGVTNFMLTENALPVLLVH